MNTPGINRDDVERRSTNEAIDSIFNLVTKESADQFRKFLRQQTEIGRKPALDDCSSTTIKIDEAGSRQTISISVSNSDTLTSFYVDRRIKDKSEKDKKERKIEENKEEIAGQEKEEATPGKDIPVKEALYQRGCSRDRRNGDKD